MKGSPNTFELPPALPVQLWQLAFEQLQVLRLQPIVVLFAIIVQILMDTTTRSREYTSMILAARREPFANTIIQCYRLGFAFLEHRCRCT